MSGHWICDQCGHDGEHADYCVELRPVSERWRGHLVVGDKRRSGSVDSAPLAPSIEPPHTTPHIPQMRQPEEPIR